MTNDWEPKVMVFTCNWCTYAAADLAGVSRLEYPPCVYLIRFMCSGRIEPGYVLTAFNEGADGVFIGGCHPGDCHYITGNYKTLRRIKMLKKMLPQLGIEPERLCLEWISAAESQKFAEKMREFVEIIRKLGPLRRDDIDG